MALVETYSKLQKKLRGEVVDVYIYDLIPEPLRVQIANIWLECFGDSQGNPAYQLLHKTLANEFGMFNFPITSHGDAGALIDFFVGRANTAQALDMIHVSFKYACFLDTSDDFESRQRRGIFRVQITSEEAISELNTRFLENGIGYQFVAGDSPGLVKKANEHLHEEAVLPALRLLHEKSFQGANDEYRQAHEHYRHGRQKECLNDCLKAFESTMKVICKKRKWAY